MGYQAAVGPLFEQLWPALAGAGAVVLLSWLSLRGLVSGTIEAADASPDLGIDEPEPAFEDLDRLARSAR